jgi:1,4-alpha-glucan branching enzyme
MFHHNEITFRMVYAWGENFVLPLSHDEVVHGKGSLLARMPGDDWQRFANLRLLLTYMYMQPGKKLLFMGGEFGQRAEWNHDQSLDWHLLEHEPHAGMQRLVRDLNHLHRDVPALHARDVQPEGFRWIEANDAQQSCLVFLRHDGASDWVLCAFNFTPLPRPNYRAGVPVGGHWQELFNSDAPNYGGSGQGNFGGVEAKPVPAHGHMRSVSLTIPPLGAVVLRSGSG